MKHHDLLSNYQDDLVKSLITPLLIELNKKEMTEIAQSHEQHSSDIPFLLLKRIYDANVNESSTNVIVVDGDSWRQKNRFILLEALMEQLQEEIKTIKNIAVIREVLVAGLSVATGGLLNQLVGSYLDKGVDFLFDEVGGQFSGLLLGSFTEQIDLTKTITSSVESLIHESSAEFLAEFTGSAVKRQLNLTSNARNELEELSNTFAQSGKHDVFQLTFKAVLATSIESPKVIYVNNPHKLDDNSLAIISLLLSYAKHKKDEDKHLGISIVYTYSDPEFQPYCEVDEEFDTKKNLLDDQRRFAQRYGMLERPNSDVPVIAVKSSLFVGRTDELSELSNHFEQRQGFTITAVSGEPGIGKTALINKHIEQIATERMVVLTMLNEAGHNSNNTGLSSLEKSILEEASRLELLKNWKEKSISFFKKIDHKKTAVEIIGKVFNNADKAINTVIAINDRARIGSSIERAIEQGIGDLDFKPSDLKHEQFDKLDKAVQELYKLSESKKPLVLFIDDSQWIDNSASEYVLTRLAQQVPSLYVVTSVRPSDAATMVKKQAKNLSLHKYSIALLEAIGTKGKQDVGRVEEVNDFDVHRIELKGFNREHLCELIHNTIHGNTSQAYELTDAIISEIGGKDADSVNALFSIEAVNMLCDDKLYRENKVERFILTKPIRFSEKVNDISACVEATFNLLRCKYQDSLSHISNTNKETGFNLMAYAVLEERLHLLQLYFAEHGNAAINTLLFSSLLGAPFRSRLVEQAVEAIATSSDPLLTPLRMHISNSDNVVSLNEEQYSVLEEIYEILLRYRADQSKYVFRHSLLDIFLSKQLDNLLSTLLAFEYCEAVDRLYELMLTVVGTYTKSQAFTQTPTFMLNKSELDNLRYYTTVLNRLANKGYQNNNTKWADRYIGTLIELAKTHQLASEVEAALHCLNQSVQISKQHYQSEPSRFATLYLSTIDHLAYTHWKQGNRKVTVELLKTYLEVCRDAGKQGDNSYLKERVGGVVTLATLLPLVERTHSVEDIVHDYVRYKGRRQKKNEILRDAIALAVTSYADNPDHFIEIYLVALNLCLKHELPMDPDKGSARQTEKIKQAKNVAIRAYPLHINMTEVREYQTLTDWLIMSQLTYSDLMPSVTEENVDLIAQRYNQSPDKWALDYSILLRKLALSYYMDVHYDKAKTLLEKSQSLVKKHMERNPYYWLEHYILVLSELSVVYSKNQDTTQCKSVLKEALTLCRNWFKSDPNDAAPIYLNTLKSVRKGGYVSLEEIHLVQYLFDHNCQEWANTYEKYLRQNMRHLERFSKQSNFHPQQEMLRLCHTMAEFNPVRWESSYVKYLHRDYFKSINPEQLNEQIVNDIQRGLEICNKHHWVEDYQTIRSHLARYPKLASEVVDH